MKFLSTSLLPRVLFVVTLFGVSSGATFLWTGRPQVAVPRLAKTTQIESQLSDGGNKAGDESAGDQKPSQAPNSSPDPTPAPRTPTPSYLTQIVTTIASLPSKINATQLNSADWENPAAIGGGTANSAAFSDVTTSGTLSAKGPVTMTQFANGFLMANGIGELSATRVSLSNSSQVADRLPTASGGTGNDFSGTAIGSVLSFSATGQMTTLAPGTTGYVLTSNGAGALPTWTASSGGGASDFSALTSGTNTSSAFVVGSGSSLGYTGSGVLNANQLLGATWAAPGTIGSGTPSTGSFTQLNAAGASSPLNVGSASQLKVDNNGRMTIVYSGDSGSLNSSGGVIFLNQTSNIGTGIGIYSNAGAEAQGNMINVKVDNPNYSQAAFYMNYDGNSNAVEITSNADDISSNALAVTGNNIQDSTVGIIGSELSRGTIKVSHYRPGSGTDSNASGISIDLKGVGTRAQGLYVDSTESGGTLGNLLRLRNESIDKFVVNYQGNLAAAGNIAQGAAGTDTTFTKQGNNSNDQFFVGTNGAFRVQRSAASSEAFRVQVAGDTQGRWLGTSDGQLKWGAGNATQDIVLKRSTANTLTLDGALVMNNSNGTLDTVIKGNLDSNLFYVNGSTDRIGVGLSAPVAALHIARNTGTLPSLLLNNTGTGDLLTASASGTTRFTVANNGNTSVGGALNVTGTTTLNSLTYTWPASLTNGYVLSTNGSGTLSWVDPATFAGTNYWQLNSGALSPATLTNQLALGTISPHAGTSLHVEKNSANNALTILNQTGTGDILTASSSGTTRFTLAESGNITTLGNIVQGVNGTNTTYQKLGNTVGDEFFVGTNGAFRVSRSAAASEAFRTQVNGDTQGRFLGTSDGQLKWGSGSLAQDVVLKRSVAGVMTLDGVLVMNNSNAAADTVIKGNLDSNLFYVSGTTDRIGIGLSAPVAALHIARNTGTLPSLLLNNTGTGDLLTASASGTTRFTVASSGNTTIGGALVIPGGATTLNGQAYTWPSSGQSSGYVLSTNGTGTLTWVDPATFAGTNQWQFNAGVVSQATLTNQVSLGTISPLANSAFYVTRNSTNNALVAFNQTGSSDIFTASASGATKFTITNTGSVSIGSAAPASRLDVTSSSTNADVQRWMASDGSRLGRMNETAGGSGFFEVDNSSGTAVALFRGDGGQNYISTGQFGLGTTSPQAPLHVNGAFGANAAFIVNQVNTGVNIMTASSSGTTRMVMTNDGSTAIGGSDPGTNKLKVFGDFEVTGACAGCSSDLRLKKNVLQLSGSSLQKLLSIKGVTYEFSDTQKAQDFPGLQIGVIAQDVEQVFPELVGTDSRGFKFVRYDKLIAPTIEALREQQGQIATIGNNVASLNSDISQGFSSVFSWVNNQWTVVTDIVFTRTVAFKDSVTFTASSLFTGKAKFEKVIAQSKDAAGNVVLPSGSSSADVTFATKYDTVPFVMLTPVGKGAMGYYVDNVTTSGFTVKIEQPLSQDVLFNWSATQTNTSAVLGATATASPVPTPAPSSTPTPSPVLSPLPLPSASPSATPASSPITSPSPTVSPVPQSSPAPSSSPIADPTPSPSPTSQP